MRVRLTGVRRLLCAAVMGLVAVSGGCGGEGDDYAARERGRMIFAEGKSPSGDEFTVSLALFGDVERSFPATRYACRNCHGPEGLPTVEGGVTVPSIQADALASPIRFATGTGRLRVPYDENSIRRAITMGIDSSGNKLNTLMPRFSISDRDLDDLMVYLRSLGKELAPGVSEDEVRIATVLHEGTADQGTVGAIRETLQAFVAETNRRGGIYGRALKLDVLSPTQWIERGAKPDGGGEHLCVVAPFGPLAGGPDELPIIGVIEPEPVMQVPAKPNTFHVYPSQVTQLRVAIDHYCDVLKHEAPSFQLVVPDDQDPETLRHALEGQVALYEGARLSCAQLGAEPVRDDTDVVLLLGSAEHKAKVIRTLSGDSSVATIYTTHIVPADLLPSLTRADVERLRLVLPIPVPAVTDPRVGQFREFLSRHDLKEDRVQLRVATMAASAVFAEALKRCGQHVTREKLLREVRSLYKFQPGLFPPISYDQNRTVGAQGAQIIRYDPATRGFVPVSDWSEPK